ncbi:hypothetical protein OC844_008042 [Tilletia horrida]|nr:hypothetical protein OC844_008042 [Tilletia horrida]
MQPDVVCAPEPALALASASALQPTRAGRPSHLRFVCPTIPTANYDFDDDGFQAALHVAAFPHAGAAPTLC